MKLYELDSWATRCRCPGRSWLQLSARKQTMKAKDKVIVNATGNTEDPAIEVRDLYMSFKTPTATKQVLQGVGLAIPRGTLHILLGPNGCGKSTLLRVLAGLFRPDSGSMHIARPHAFVFQNPDHQVVMPTVAADVAFGLGRYDLDDRAVHAAVRRALQQVGLAGLEDRPTSSLSGGQKQRVAIAGALAENPSVLLMDELTTFLDYKDQRNVIECVRSIVDGADAPPLIADDSGESDGDCSRSSISSNGVAGSGSSSSSSSGGSSSSSCSRGVTALWVTHRLEELDYADHVSYMDGGRIVFSGSPQEMRGYMRRLGAHI